MNLQLQQVGARYDKQLRIFHLGTKLAVYILFYCTIMTWQCNIGKKCMYPPNAIIKSKAYSKIHNIGTIYCQSILFPIVHLCGLNMCKLKMNIPCITTYLKYKISLHDSWANCNCSLQTMHTKLNFALIKEALCKTKLCWRACQIIQIDRLHTTITLNFNCFYNSYTLYVTQKLYKLME